MKALHVLFFLLLAPCFAAVGQEGSAGKCKVTYIANEGFLISTETNKVLIDALFGDIKGDWCDQPADSLARSMLSGVPPFDQIDAVLITHKHADHFNAKMVIEFLQNHLHTIVICPAQVKDLMKREPGFSDVSTRVRTLNSLSHPDTIFQLNNLKITALRFPHGSYMITDSVTGIPTDIHKEVENFGYLIETDGFTVFHSGDGSSSNKAPFEAFGFRTKELDLAFVDRSFLGRDGQEILNEYLHAQRIVFMHIEPGKTAYYKSVIKDFPGLVIFSRPMEEMVYRKEP